MFLKGLWCFSTNLVPEDQCLGKKWYREVIVDGFAFRVERELTGLGRIEFVTTVCHYMLFFPLL